VGIILNSRRNTASFLHLLLALFLSLQVLSVPSSAADATADEVWLLVDTENLTISVMRGKALLYKYDNIAIGSNGPSVARRVSDQTTPLGEFRISGINPRSRFHLFMANDNPTKEQARSALADGRISPDEYMAVSNAWLGGEPPPQDTRLGGYLGIHGVGDGNTGIHGLVNWTDGCIAVTNEQMDELARWVGVGTRVSVR
jgi:lipoprotein-anchoring transpeptidase ErfK/SrfK